MRRLFLFLPLFLLVRYSKTFQRFPKVDWRPSAKLLRTLTPVELQFYTSIAAAVRSV